MKTLSIAKLSALFSLRPAQEKQEKPSNGGLSGQPLAGAQFAELIDRSAESASGQAALSAESRPDDGADAGAPVPLEEGTKGAAPVAWTEAREGAFSSPSDLRNTTQIKTQAPSDDDKLAAPRKDGAVEPMPQSPSHKVANWRQSLLDAIGQPQSKPTDVAEVPASPAPVPVAKGASDSDAPTVKNADDTAAPDVAMLIGSQAPTAASLHTTHELSNDRADTESTQRATEVSGGKTKDDGTDRAAPFASVAPASRPVRLARIKMEPIETLPSATAPGAAKSVGVASASLVRARWTPQAPVDSSAQTRPVSKTDDTTPAQAPWLAVRAGHPEFQADKGLDESVSQPSKLAFAHPQDAPSVTEIAQAPDGEATNTPPALKAVAPEMAIHSQPKTASEVVPAVKVEPEVELPATHDTTKKPDLMSEPAPSFAASITETPPPVEETALASNAATDEVAVESTIDLPEPEPTIAADPANEAGETNAAGRIGQDIERLDVPSTEALGEVPEATIPDENVTIELSSVDEVAAQDSALEDGAIEIDPPRPERHRSFAESRIGAMTLETAEPEEIEAPAAVDFQPTPKTTENLSEAGALRATGTASAEADPLVANVSQTGERQDTSGQSVRAPADAMAIDVVPVEHDRKIAAEAPLAEPRDDGSLVSKRETKSHESSQDAKAAAPSGEVRGPEPSPVSAAVEPRVAGATPADRTEPMVAGSHGVTHRAAPAHGLGHQVAQALADAPNRVVELTLSPEELGKVRMTLHSTESSMTVAVQADRPETLDLMRRNIDSLAREFRDMGYADVSFDFGQQSNPQSKAQEQANVAPASPDPVAFSAAQVAAESLAVESGGGLDLRM